jgi:hypothetical protein
MIEHKPQYYSVTIDTANWDDGSYGQTLLARERVCATVTGWTWEPGNHWNFGDVVADHRAAFRLPLDIESDCVERGIEGALGLQPRTVTCETPEPQDPPDPPCHLFPLNCI